MDVWGSVHFVLRSWNTSFSGRTCTG